MADKDAKQFSSISVFFPCYNEEANVTRVAEDAIEVLKKTGLDYEVIIVDDGSKDNTAKVAEGIAAKHANVKVIRHHGNKGYGAALQSGFRAATKQLVFYTDGDGQFDISEMPPLIPLMQKYDIVSCYRLNRQDNLVRKLNAWCWTNLVCILFRMNLRDIDCAFKLYKREIFDHIKMTSTGALIDTEILARAIKSGYTVTQKGVHHYPRTAGTQTGAKLKVIIRAFSELFKLHKQIKNDLKEQKR